MKSLDLNKIDEITVLVDDGLEIYYLDDPPEQFMPRRHRHNSIELNYIEQGWIQYFRGGEIFQAPERRFVLFWGSIPHHVVATKPKTRFYAMHLPLAWFLGIGLQECFSEHILQGRMAIEPKDDRGPLDLMLFREWHADLNAESGTDREIVLLEVQARLHRLAKSLRIDAHWAHDSIRGKVTEDLGKVELMAGYVAKHFTDEDMRVTDIAASVGLHPKYATQLFRRKCGMSLKQYITMNRVHHAQLLLITTDSTILDVAMFSGFGTAGHFYAAFRDVCGQTPSDYRRSMRK